MLLAHEGDMRFIDLIRGISRSETISKLGLSNGDI